MKNLMILCCLFLAQITFAQTPDEIMKAMGGKKPPVKSEYSFATSMKYEVSSSKGSNSKMNFTYLLPSSGEEAIGIEISDASKGKMINRSVFDMKNKAMIMIIEQQKMAMIIPMDLAKTTADVQSDPKLKMSPPTKTGKTKVILGYTCDEWVSENQDYKSSMWICSSANLPTNGLMDMMKHSVQKSGNFGVPTGMSGFPLEMDSYSKQKNTSSTMICVEINKNAAQKISTAGYRVM